MLDWFCRAVIAVPGLDEAARRFTDLGCIVAPGGRYSGLGTRNAFVQCGVEQSDAELGATNAYMPLDAQRTTYRVGRVAIRLALAAGDGAGRAGPHHIRRRAVSALPGGR
jgi:Glyoxalase-like domain